MTGGGIGFEMLVLLVVLPLAFSFMNGFHDAANSIATFASTRVLRPQFAVAWVAFFNFIAFLFFSRSSSLHALFGGWRIVKTMGQKITRLKPVGGFCAETGGAITLFLATGLGIPASTTHTITGAIVGVGAVHKLSAIRWGIAGRIVWAWVLTIPCAAFMSAVAWWVATQVF
jgi:phosphate/sulfate permease